MDNKLNLFCLYGFVYKIDDLDSRAEREGASREENAENEHDFLVRCRAYIRNDQVN